MQGLENSQIQKKDEDDYYLLMLNPGDENLSFVTITVSIFLIINAVGQIPLFLSILAPYEHHRQKKIIVRELLIGLGILLLFNFFGNEVLNVLGITHPIIGMAGGILLFLIAMDMVFPKEKKTEGFPKHEPMVVPLAMPVITGPGAITAVMLFAHQTGKEFMVAGAATLAWAISLIILLAASYIRNFLGEKGLQAVERLGGLIVCLIGIQMFSSGVISLVKENF